MEQIESIINDETGKRVSPEPIVIVSKNGEQINSTHNALNVILQDAMTPLISFPLGNETSSFTLAVDTQISTEDTFYFDITVEAGHSIVAGNKILLSTTSGSRIFYAIVLNVATNVITLDSPLDFCFIVGETNAGVIYIEMAVDGSSTIKSYLARGGNPEFDIQFVTITMLCKTQPDDSLFGDLPALTNGIVFRFVDGFTKNLGVIKRNGDFRKLGFEVVIQEKAGGGAWSLSAQIDLKKVHGVVVIMDPTQIFQALVQDKIDGLDGMEVWLLGHKVDTPNGIVE